jgi:ketosteroid isomerase-like protein
MTRTGGEMLHRLLLAASVGLMAAVAAVPTRAAPAIDGGRSAAAVGRSWIAAVNRGDLPGAVALVAPNGVFDIGGTRYRGRAAIRRWIGGDPIASDGRYTILRVQRSGRAAVFTLDFRAGTSREALRYRFVTERRRIVMLTARYR